MDALKKQVASLLTKDRAHVGFAKAVGGLQPKLRGVKPDGVEHSAWELLEHLRIAQWDILEYSRNPKHVSPEFPAGYWPKQSAPPDDKAWDDSVAAFERDLAAMADLVKDEKTDLLAPLPHAEKHTLLREALILADHNAYHIGQMVLLRRFLRAWD